ncbi:MAG TPA: SAM-dependent methyltransferase [Phycisphaerae bacterium]|nr:SAM-dependent methyltransferase [Phycisphaerae bacterium]
MAPNGRGRQVDRDEKDNPYVSRGGLKLRAALDAFHLRPDGWVCADFGANVGGFTDCLLAAGARRVYAVDTGYGELAWKLRTDPRVVVMERTNALYAAPPEPVDLVTIDVAFTPQRLIVPAAARWVRPGGHIVSLLKPHYETAKLGGPRPAPRQGPLLDEQAESVARKVCQELEAMGMPPAGRIASPLKGKGGNTEFLLHIRPPAAGERKTGKVISS